MDGNLQERFTARWRQYFGEAELPIACYYTDQEDAAPPADTPTGHCCVIGALAEVRRGASRRFDAESVGCWGGKRYFGFTQAISPTFDYFLSCGIPGTVEGERYKKSPELVRAFVEGSPRFTAPARFLVFKRWDRLEAQDTPEVVIFFARAEVLSGLFTLANFGEADLHGVIAPFSASRGRTPSVCTSTPRVVWLPMPPGWGKCCWRAWRPRIWSVGSAAPAWPD